MTKKPKKREKNKFQTNRRLLVRLVTADRFDQSYLWIFLNSEFDWFIIWLVTADCGESLLVPLRLWRTLAALIWIRTLIILILAYRQVQDLDLHPRLQLIRAISKKINKKTKKASKQTKTKTKKQAKYIVNIVEIVLGHSRHANH